MVVAAEAPRWLGGLLLLLVACSAWAPTNPAAGCACHARSGVGGSHAGLPCVACHGGDAGSRERAAAHRDLLQRPGSLAQAARSCSCHGSIIARVQRSPMATARGLVAVDRFAFGEQPRPEGWTTLQQLGDSTADGHLRELCDGCHLSARRPAPGVRVGCLACHFAAPAAGATHPGLTLDVSLERCESCHRGTGRVALSYQGWNETALAPAAVAGQPGYRALPDGRVLEAAPADLHFTRGMTCIDCHTARELMGDGRDHQHQEDAVEISCGDCHRQDPPRTLGWAELDEESRLLLTLRRAPRREALRYVAAQRGGGALSNVVVDEAGRVQVLLKASQRALQPRPPAVPCREAVHRRLTCQACHSGWAPQCVGCHSQREPGGWREYGGASQADPPVLGVRGADQRIDTFVPGMVQTINPRVAPPDADLDGLAAESTLRRLYAPLAPHTTTHKGRGCASCHQSALALGYGRGALRLPTSAPGGWRFESRYVALADGLPADAWIGFLEQAQGRATRTDARPLSRLEQLRVLRVGARLSRGAARGADRGPAAPPHKGPPR